MTDNYEAKLDQLRSMGVVDMELTFGCRIGVEYDTEYIGEGGQQCEGGQDSVERSNAEVCLKCNIIKDISTENTNEYGMYTLARP